MVGHCIGRFNGAPVFMGTQLPNDVSVERFLSREILGVVEAAAIAAARFMGMGDRNAVDSAATEAMREHLARIPMTGTIVIGEGERDEAPMLFIGEKVGNAELEDLPEMDIAVDPVEGTNLVANGLPNAIATLALSRKGGLFHAPDTYMRKLIVGPSAKGKVDINAPVRYNLSVIAMSLERDIEDITVVILDRPRHEELIREVRHCGARIKLITDGDVMPAITASLSGSGIHAVMGIGGAPEGVLAAAAIKCLGGEIQAQLKWRSDEERKRAEEMGLNSSEEEVYLTDDLVPGDEIVFAASGVTTGDTLTGVRYFGTGARTHSVVTTYKSGIIRFVDTIHQSSERRGPVKFH
jgi:fructose-1,6-bisphosphatase II